MKKIVFLALSLFLFAPPVFGWMEPDSVDVVLNIEDNQFAFYNGPSGQAEWLVNNGTRTSIRIKGYDDPSALKWDLSAYRGKAIEEAELHLCLTSGSMVHALVASTINSEWSEGTKHGSNAGQGDSCWRWRSYPDGEWTYRGSDFSTATFGNFGTLVSFGYKHKDTFRQYVSGSNTWVAMKLDPSMVHALILDNPGLVVTDPRFGSENGNPRIYSSEQNATVQPRLYLKVSSDIDVTSPGDITNIIAATGEWNGEVVLSFIAPGDPEDGLAFGYDVRYGTNDSFTSASKVERWRIPRPGTPGSTDRILIEDLQPETLYYFWIRAYDKVGNLSNFSETSLTLPAELPQPQFINGPHTAPEPEGRQIPNIDNILRYWACSELTKVNPLTGARLMDGYTTAGSDDYKKANGVWDAAINRVSVQSVRNQIVGFQVVIERLVSSLTGLSVTASDLAGPDGAVITASDNIDFFKLHYTSGETPYPDPAIPLAPPFSSTFDIPSVNNVSGLYQSIWVDLYVPRDTAPGIYTGTLTLSGDQLSSPVVIDLHVDVASPVIPDRPTFFLDLNGYGNKWSSESSRYQVFQLSHKHRMVPNTLPYNWSENWRSDRAPQLSGSGSSRQISDWSEFASIYGPFFDGSAFSPSHPTYPYHGPGENTGIANFYTTGFEGWPLSISDPTYGYDAVSGGKGHSYWNNLVDSGGTGLQTFWLEAPDIMEAFPPESAIGVKNVWKQFAEYAQAHNWTTAFQYYLNNKRSYSGTSSLWTLEEQYVADDFRADAWFMGLCRQGWESAEAPDVKFHWRIDTSTRWQQNWNQLAGIVNLRVQGDGKNWDYRHDRYRRYTRQHSESRWYYGTGPSRTDSLTAHSAEILGHWSHGLDGGLPYWNNFDNNWTTATGSDGGEDATLSILLSGSTVPGHGSFDGRIGTIRMKGMRYGQQLCELLNMLAQQPGWNGNLVRRALSNGYGNKTGTGYDNFGGDEYTNMTILDYFRLQSDLTASLEKTLLLGDVNGDKMVDLRDGVGALQIQAGGTLVSPRVEGDVNGDGKIGMVEALFILQKCSSAGGCE